MGPLFIVLHLALSNVNAVDGNGLYEMCGSDRFGCFMYLFGYIDGAHQYGREFCFPSNTEPEQLRKVIWHYLNTHPSDRDQPAGELIRIAIDDAWPCEGDDNNLNKE